MSATPHLLDLFCGGGGCSRGYQMAGFHVTGVDIAAQPRYCGDHFIQADALTVSLAGYDVIHASPVCKGYSPLNAYRGRTYPREVITMIARLEAAGVPFVVENVPGARAGMPRGLVLCGSMFGLPIRRHRVFESNVLLFAPGPCSHRVDDLAYAQTTRGRGWTKNGESAYRTAMGVGWMRAREDARQAIPPAYTQWIGTQLMAALQHTPVGPIPQAQVAS